MNSTIEATADRADCGPILETPPKPNRGPEFVPWKRRVERFTVSSEGGVEMIHEGPGLTLDRLLEWEVNPDRAETNLGGDSDVIVWHRGQVVAIVRRLDGLRPVVHRIEPERTPIEPY